MQAVALPPLRDELSLHPGPVGHDGAPSWTLHDPLRNQFFRLSWPAFEVLSRWTLGDPEAVAEAVREETTLDMDADDVMDVAEFFARSQLLRTGSPAQTERLLAMKDAAKTSWATWLLHHYLFFRFPLVRPDALLERMLPWLAWLGGRRFRLATVAALVASLFLIGRQWNTFVTTFVDHVSLSGLAAFGIALGFAKIIHELGHALTAKALGCRVPTMGVAFLVMMPVLYTDVNEAWKLTDRRQRLLIGGAGILSELALAVWASLLWGLLPEGGLREVLFSLGEPVPEPLPPRRRLALIAFAVAVWVYRLTLFLGIAVLVYHFFIKVVGALLFAVEMGWFVARPFLVEFAEWYKRAGRIKATRRSRFTFGLIAGLVLLAVVPWSGRVTAPAILKAADHATLYAPVPATLHAVLVAEGQYVAAGTTLAELTNPDLDYRLAQAERHMSTLKYELASVSFEDSFRGRSQAIAKELEAAEAERNAAAGDMARLGLKAPVAGLVADISPDLQPGQWISPREPVLSVRQGAVLEAFVAEEDLPRIRVGATATFIPDGTGDVAMAATITAIDRMAARSLTEPALAVPYGGIIPARFDHQTLVPDVAVYGVRLTLAKPTNAPVVQRGQVHIDGERRSALGRLARSAIAILLREWGT
jgi:putative peptide zinc metalloprotease protein